MEFFKKKTQINFLQKRHFAGIFSLLLFFGSVLIISLKGLHWGLDFTGGTQVQLAFENPVQLPPIRQQLSQTHLRDAQVQTLGNSQTILLSLAAAQVDEATRADLTQRLEQIFPAASIKSIAWIGPQAGQALWRQGIYALIFALLGMLVYVSVRFNYRFAIGAVVALIHDPMIILGVFSGLQVEFNLMTLAAILTVIGYSLNNVIVIFDRIRENFLKLKQHDILTIVNLSINETLSRTCITAGTTLMIVLILYLAGGLVLQGFAFALIIGIVAGSYSAIYIASAAALALGLKQEPVLLQPKSVADTWP
jgi:preprotein translocase subunit SecF